MKNRPLLLALSLSVLGTLSCQAQTRPETNDLDAFPLNHVQLAGSHNTFDKKDEYEYLSDAFADVQMVEIDAWTNFGSWRVSHSNPLANINNCPKSGLAGNDRNQDLRSCVDNIARYHRDHPNHPLLIIKLELKNGFGASTQPADLDDLIADIQGSGAGARIPERDLYTPRDLMCIDTTCSSRHPTPEAALATKPWPTLGQLRGKVMFVLIPGTVSDSAPRDYAAALANGKARLAFPAIAVKQPSDPRPAYYGANAPWNVIFDLQAGRLDSGEIPSTLVANWALRNFLLSVNDDQPGGANADVAQGRARLHQLARDFNANIVNTDQERSGIPASFAIP